MLSEKRHWSVISCICVTFSRRRFLLGILESIGWDTDGMSDDVSSDYERLFRPRVTEGSFFFTKPHIFWTSWQQKSIFQMNKKSTLLETCLPQQIETLARSGSTDISPLCWCWIVDLFHQRWTTTRRTAKLITFSGATHSRFQPSTRYA